MNDKFIVKWYSDAAFATHNDLRSHTGGTMTMGHGGIINISTKQKLNTKSSTEAELVGVDDVMPQILWTRYFLEAQGVKMPPSTIAQDNQSAILLEKNGKRSSGERTRALNIRFFLVTDHIEKGDLTVKYCPTDKMLVDFYTKPLQGKKFSDFRKEIMGFV